METVVSGGQFLRTFGLIVLSIAVLFAIDTFLRNLERSEDRAEAKRLMTEGEDLIRRGEYAGAVDPLINAVFIDRENPAIRLTVAEALLGAGRVMDAEDALTTLLQREPTSGPINLAMARVLVKESRTREATFFYHRAIYGQWQTNSNQSRLSARLELVDLLAHQNEKADLLSELLPLQEETVSAESRQEIGRLFILAGSPNRAADVFRALLSQNPGDPKLLEGLGDAEFAGGNYQAAQSAFIAAAQMNSADKTIQQHLEECNRVLALDPTRRGLPPAERYRRSVELITGALEQASLCKQYAAKDQELFGEAQDAIKRRVPRSRHGQLVEGNIELAEQVWRAASSQCQASTSTPIALVLAKVAQ